MGLDTRLEARLHLSEGYCKGIVDNSLNTLRNEIVGALKDKLPIDTNSLYGLTFKLGYFRELYEMQDWLLIQSFVRNEDVDNIYLDTENIDLILKNRALFLKGYSKEDKKEFKECFEKAKSLINSGFDIYLLFY